MIISGQMLERGDEDFSSMMMDLQKIRDGKN